MNQKIVYQGEVGSFAYLALQKYLAKKNLDKSSFDLLPCPEFVEIFDLVEQNKAQYGIVPIENSLAGSVISNYDLFRDKEVFIIDELILPIKHHLICLPDAELKDIKQVYSHPKALDQCINFIKQHKFQSNVFNNTALAVKFIKEKGNKTLSAIGSREAAENFGLKIVKEEIQDHKLNWTRFFIFKRSEFSNIWQIDKNKISIAYTLDREKPGSLVNSLRLFSDKNLNLTNIEARPILGSFFEYYFYLDIEFSLKDLKEVKKSIKELETIAKKIKILGVYEKDRLVFAPSLSKRYT